MLGGPAQQRPGATPGSRVRRRVLPVLEDELGPGVAADAGPDRRPAARRHGPASTSSPPRSPPPRPPTTGSPVAALAGAAAAVRRRVLRLAALAAGAPASELFHEHVLAVDALLTDWRGQKWIDLPGHLRAVRRDGLLVVERAPSPPAQAAPTELPRQPAWKFGPRGGSQAVLPRDPRAFPRCCDADEIGPVDNGPERARVGTLAAWSSTATRPFPRWQGLRAGISRASLDGPGYQRVLHGVLVAADRAGHRRG